MAKKISEEDTTKTIQIGDKYYNEDDVTPSVYFEYVKGLKQKLNRDEYNIVVDTALTMLEKTKKTGQTAMAKELTHQIELALRELDAANDGFDIFINRKDIERYIHDVKNKVIKIVELNKYEREIPDDVLEKLTKAQKHFDQIYIFFTDYTTNETKKVAKERRDKDPIMLGAFHDKDEILDNKIYLEDRLFFVADWVEDKCDLTLEQIVRDVKDKEGKDIAYKVSNPEDEKAVKDMIKSFNKPIEDMKPVSLFEKIKKKVTRKKKEESSEETTTPKKRGRKKKVEE